MSWFSKWFSKKKQFSDLTEEDFLMLGAKLVGVFSAGIEPDVPSVTCLKTLAKNWAPDATENKIDWEVFFLHKFLLVHSLPLRDVSPIVSRPVLGGFYAALEAIIKETEIKETEIKDTECALFVSQFIQSRINTDSEEVLAKLEKAWMTRTKAYEEPFELDHQEWLEKGKGKGHLPWKRTMIRFMTILRKPTEKTVEEMKGIDGFVTATLTVGLTFAAYTKQTLDAILDTLN